MWCEPERCACFHSGMSLKEDAGEGRNGLIILKMVINMNEAQLRTIEQIEQFLSGCAVIEFSTAGDDSERYTHISRVLKRFDYPGRSKRERGVLRRYLEHTSGYSRAQVARLVARWQGNRLATVPLIKRYGPPAKPFARKYTAADIALLVEMDKAPRCHARSLPRRWWIGIPRRNRWPMTTAESPHLSRPPGICGDPVAPARNRQLLTAACASQPASGRIAAIHQRLERDPRSRHDIRL